MVLLYFKKAAIIAVVIVDEAFADRLRQLRLMQDLGKLNFGYYCYSDYYFLGFPYWPPGWLPKEAVGVGAMEMEGFLTVIGRFTLLVLRRPRLRRISGTG